MKSEWTSLFSCIALSRRQMSNLLRKEIARSRINGIRYLFLIKLLFASEKLDYYELFFDFFYY